MSRINLNRIRRALLHWYDRNRRDLPWRRTHDPYAIWIAETMLQQTQIKTVLPYYRRFLSAFPTMKALDRAPREKVLALWSGLGYYRRAENLKRAARKIMDQHRGKLPRKGYALRALPGVGPYTAGALMSIAFNEPYPALDGNARRVLTRVFDVKTEKDLRETAQRLIPRARPGCFNQALMELGSTICLPREPRCDQCPIASCCKARKSERVRLQKPFSPKPAARKIDWPLALIQKDGKILLRRQPAGGILPGLWEVPGGERSKGESLMAALRRHLSGLGAKVHAKLIGEIRHSITHRRIRAPVYLCACLGKNSSAGAGLRWFPLRSLGRYPLSALSLKAIKLIAEP